jgi:cation transport regulator ChaC
MAQKSVWVFFYGSFIDLDVLKRADVVPEQFEVARLGGFDVQIKPLANLVRSEQHCVYGIVAATTHQELHGLYSQGWVSSYLPEAVLVETLDGKWRAALCYVAPELAAEPAAEEYVEKIVRAARKYGFPDWYIDRLERFRGEVLDGWSR